MVTRRQLGARNQEPGASASWPRLQTKRTGHSYCHQFGFICFEVLFEIGSGISKSYPCYIVQLLGDRTASNVLLTTA